MYIGTVHGNEYVIGLHAPRTKIGIFSKINIGSQISKLPMGEGVCICFEILCSQQNAAKLLGTINSLTLDEANFVDKWCDWSKTKN